MTDDERMDRARRIREMREGSRPEAQSDDSGDADAGGGPSDSDADSAGADSGVADGNSPAVDPDGGADSADAETAADEGGATDVDGPGAADPDDAGAADSDSGDHQAPGPDGSPGSGAGEDEDATIHIPGAEVGDVEVDVEDLADQAGLETAETGAEVVPDPEEGGVGTAAAGRADAGVETSADETRVLEFDLGDERYCLAIEHVEEIVKRETITRVPNTPDYVEGVVDLRGQITTILDPKVLLDIDAEGSKELIVVFDPDGFEDQGAIGWVVDDVNQVTPISADDVNDSPVEQDGINGVVDRDDEFVIWTTPAIAVEEATG